MMSFSPQGLSTVSQASHSHPSEKLPTELWREIFVHATRVPGGYDTSYVSPFDFFEVTDGHNVFLSRLAENHSTKQALCLVSKRWRAIAQELIFEYLFLQDTFDWNKLADGLEDSMRYYENAHNQKHQCGNCSVGILNGHGAGWYVRRLEISAMCWTPELGAAAARVIRCCPNLRVLTITAFEDSIAAPGSDAVGPNAAGLPPNPGIRGIHAELVAAIFQSCPHALRSLDWACGLGPAQIVDMFCLLPRAQKLQSIFICIHSDLSGVLGDLKALKSREDEKIEMPNLHTIELVSPNADPSDVLETLAAWRLPVLRQVVLCGQASLQHAGRFFTEHGPKLKALEFDYAGDHNHTAGDYESDSEEDVGRGAAIANAMSTSTEEIAALRSHDLRHPPKRGAAMVLVRSVNLRELVLQVLWAASQAAYGHKSVERIGLRGLYHFAHPRIRPSDAQGLASVGGAAVPGLGPAELAILNDGVAQAGPAPATASVGAGTGAATGFRAIQNVALAMALGEHIAEQHAVLHALGAAFPIFLDRSRFPSVRVVRLLDFDQKRCFRAGLWRAGGVAFWTLWVKRFEREGVRLEDQSGELVRVVFREVNVFLSEDLRQDGLMRSRDLIR